MTVAYGQFIAGDWLKPSNAVANVNPSNIGDTVGEFAHGGAAEVDAAVAAAKAAFPAWSRTAPYDRGNYLKKVALELEARRDELARQLAREEGKTLAEATGELLRAAQVFDYYGAEAVRIGGEFLAGLRQGVTTEVTRDPVGVVAAITPWNFPIFLPAGKIAAALAYGNCVVFKPSEVVPASAVALVEISGAFGPAVRGGQSGDGRWPDRGPSSDRTPRRRRGHLHRFGADLDA